MLRSARIPWLQLGSISAASAILAISILQDRYGILAIVGVAIGVFLLEKADSARESGTTLFLIALITVGTVVLGLGAAAPAAAILIGIVQAAPYWYIGVLLYRVRVHPSLGPIRFLVFALALTGFERFMAERMIFGDYANTFLNIALTQTRSPLLPLAAFVGAYGLSLAVYALGCLLYLAVLKRRVMPIFSAGLAIATVSILYGWIPSGVADGLNVAVVQVPPVRADREVDDGRRDLVLRDLQGYSKEMATLNDPNELVVWGEGALRGYLEQNQTILQPILARFDDALIGGFTNRNGEEFNSVIRWNRVRTQLESVYDKRVLVPLAEMRLTRGREAPYVNVNRTRIGMGICWENGDAATSRAIADSNANGIVYFVSNVFAQQSRLPALHALVSRMRAVELGRDTIHASRGGPSELINARGVVLKHIDQGAAGMFRSVFARITVETPFRKSGDIIGVLAMLFALNVMVILNLPKRFGVRQA